MDGSVQRLAELPLERRYPETAPAENLVDVVLGRAGNGSPLEIGISSSEFVDAMHRSAKERKTIRHGLLAEPERVGQVWRVKPGKADEYMRRHRTIWPELEQLLFDAGVTTYTIYAWGEVVFSHLETEDFDRLIERFERDPLVQRWEEYFADILEYPNADLATGWPERLTQVWNL